ncbi:fimbrial-like adhesin protein SfmF [compost metagenome]
MKIKSKLLAAALLSTASVGAFAYDAQVNFDGLVTDQTCDINGTSVRPAQINVVLPTIGVSALPTVGSWAQNTKFTIKLANCTAASTTVHWEPMVNVDSDTGALKNTAAGTNAQLRVLDSNYTPIDMRSDAGITFSGTSKDLDYYAQYYANVVPVTAGVLSTYGYITLTY